MEAQLFQAARSPSDTDERLTPPWVFDGLGLTFDLDPASPADRESFVPAAHRYTADDDGLAQLWFGTVWLNPPYSQSTQWARRFIRHGDGIFFGPHANSAWLLELAAASDLFALVADLPFIGADHTVKRAGMALVMAAIGPRSCQAVERLHASGRHPMVILTGHQPA